MLGITDRMELVTLTAAMQGRINATPRTSLDTAQHTRIGIILSTLQSKLEQIFVPMNTRTVTIDKEGVETINKALDKEVFNATELHSKERPAIENFLITLSFYFSVMPEAVAGTPQRTVCDTWLNGSAKNITILYCAVIDRIGPLEAAYQQPVSIGMGAIASLFPVLGAIALAGTMAATGGATAIIYPALLAVVGVNVAGAVARAGASATIKEYSELAWVKAHPMNKFRNAQGILEGIARDSDTRGFETVLKEVINAITKSDATMESITKEAAGGGGAGGRELKFPDAYKGKPKERIWESAKTGAAFGALVGTGVGGAALVAAAVAHVAIPAGCAFAPAALANAAAAHGTAIGGANGVIIAFSTATTPLVASAAPDGGAGLKAPAEVAALFAKKALKEAVKGVAAAVAPAVRGAAAPV